MNPLIAMLAAMIALAAPTVKAEPVAGRTDPSGGFKAYATEPTDNPLLRALGLPKKGGGFALPGYNLWHPSIIKVGNPKHPYPLSPRGGKPLSRAAAGGAKKRFPAAIKSGKVLEWDPAKERITNHPEAMAHMTGSYREPWDLKKFI